MHTKTRGGSTSHDKPRGGPLSPLWFLGKSRRKLLPELKWFADPCSTVSWPNLKDNGGAIGIAASGKIETKFDGDVKVDFSLEILGYPTFKIDLLGSECVNISFG